MRIQQILEARRYPEINKKISALDALRKYQGQDDVFVSFTDDVGKQSHLSASIKSVAKGGTGFGVVSGPPNSSGAKLGINPRTDHGTPLGIYGYPIKHVLDKELRVEYGRGRPFIWVFRIKDVSRVLDFSTYTDEDLDRDIEKLSRLNKNNSDFTYILNSAKKTATLQTPYFTIWNLTRLLAMSDNRSNYPIKWSALLRTIGYDCAIDRTGLKVIHQNEPKQGVFFGRDTIEILELVKNITPREPPSLLQILRTNNKILKNMIIQNKLSETILIQLVDSGASSVVVSLYKHLPDKVKAYIKTNFADLVFYGIPISEMGFSDEDIIDIIWKNPQILKYFDYEDISGKILNYILDDIKQRKDTSVFARYIEEMNVPDNIKREMYNNAPASVGYGGAALGAPGMITILNNIHKYEKEYVFGYLKNMIWSKKYPSEVYIKYGIEFIDTKSIGYYLKSLRTLATQAQKPIITSESEGLWTAYVKLFYKLKNKDEIIEELKNLPKSIIANIYSEYQNNNYISKSTKELLPIFLSKNVGYNKEV